MYLRVAVGGILVILSMSVEAKEPCAPRVEGDADPKIFSVKKSIEIRLRKPDPDAQLVALTTEHGFTVLAKQSKYIPLADYRQNGRTGLDPYDFYWWLRSRQPVDVIDLSPYRQSANHKEFYLMQLVESEDFYVKSISSADYLESAHLEWYTCNLGEWGGRRLRTDSNQTIIWQFDWIA